MSVFKCASAPVKSQLFFFFFFFFTTLERRVIWCLRINGEEGRRKKLVGSGEEKQDGTDRKRRNRK